MKEAAETDVDLSDDEFCRVDLIAVNLHEITFIFSF